MTKEEALKLALEALETSMYPQQKQLQAITAIEAALEAKDEIDWKDMYVKEKRRSEMWVTKYKKDIGPLEKAIPHQEAKDEPVAWISVKDELPKAVRGVSYKSSLTDTVLVLHSDRPDYPITAHAVVGEGLGAGVAIPTDGASEHPEIAWYSASCNLNNPFNLKNDDYERFLPKIFGKKITHWMPIPTTPPQRRPLTVEQPKVRTGDCLLVGVCASEGHKIQPQRTWVALTDEERNHARQTVTYSQLAMTAAEWAEAVQIETERRLKEKNK